ncbi:hypothetical protein Pmani_034591 [Petrolisthes manimaculis]|uniref:Uncharacterized protein n=1 Tax=Petrolisthes manimaculis TaxID=1843537 RepID=A0AAE1NN93_9EUCA|nr:hypothetical protein Pmani_034591 [Petrolisthes manimaculis]
MRPPGAVRILVARSGFKFFPSGSERRCRPGTRDWWLDVHRREGGRGGAGGGEVGGGGVGGEVGGGEGGGEDREGGGGDGGGS